MAENILNLIGFTPMVKLERLAGAGRANILAKLESRNPGGSVKDRIALSMILAAEEKELLGPGYAVVEPTSGNTGIGLAMVCAVKGYKCFLTMPDTMSPERRKILELFGAELTLTPGADGMRGAVREAERLAGGMPLSYMPQQFRNPANPRAHRMGTGPEIWERSCGRVDIFIAGVGTGGTITGAGEYLKEKNPGIKIIAVEPASSPVLSGGSPGPHGIQGIGAGFVPEVLNTDIIDEIITVTDENARRTSALLASEEGMLCGISSGAAVWAGLKIAKGRGAGKNIVVILPDTGERYLSTRGSAC